MKGMPMSFTAVILPILAALSIAEEKFLGFEGSWQAFNAEQQVLMEKYWPFRTQLERLLPEESRSIASADIAEINQFLKDNGFNIQLRNNGRGGFRVASILKIMLKWKKPGTETILETDTGSYPAVYMKAENNAEFSIAKSSNGGNVLMVKAENGDTVYMQPHENAIHGDEPLKEFKLIEYGKDLVTQELVSLTSYYEGALFPMVDLDQSSEIDWLLGLAKSSYMISQALYQTKFQMNEKGAIAQSAVALLFERSCHQVRYKPTFKIDKPFYLWIVRDGVSVPLFAAYIDTGDWKKRLS